MSGNFPEPPAYVIAFVAFAYPKRSHSLGRFLPKLWPVGFSSGPFLGRRTVRVLASLRG
ncbi:hypothetical protein SAMN04488061_2840 [Filomicrobium insigne]|uniref:Uncharacterized protein n=1 Tax=Filomicrobium insigne TaxID=418854 RepID=A0A1H0SD40_9HYPH|nr:hypothetical protein SAMN04488061_2840 [Filomicrobium insigne]